MAAATVDALVLLASTLNQIDILVSVDSWSYQ